MMRVEVFIMTGVYDLNKKSEERNFNEFDALRYIDNGIGAIIIGVIIGGDQLLLSHLKK